MKSQVIRYRFQAPQSRVMSVCLHNFPTPHGHLLRKLHRLQGNRPIQPSSYRRAIGNESIGRVKHYGSMCLFSISSTIFPVPAYRLYCLYNSRRANNCNMVQSINTPDEKLTYGVQRNSPYKHYRATSTIPHLSRLLYSASRCHAKPSNSHRRQPCPIFSRSWCFLS